MERACYAIRGEALRRLFDERECSTDFFSDPAKNRDACSCTFRWLEVYLPDSARYCQEALVSRQRLHSDVPLDKAANISRANLRVLEGASESVRRRPDVQEAAQQMTEKQFASQVGVVIIRPAHRGHGERSSSVIQRVMQSRIREGSCHSGTEMRDRGSGWLSAGAGN